jgi:hypothetical protein
VLGIAPSIGFLLIMGLVWGLAWGFQETVFVALAMNLADIRIAASMFALMMAISNLGTAIGEGAATALVDDFGFTTVLWLLGGINLLTLPILWGLFKKIAAA